jgi:MFS superfamily sulfate permease-like transporter
MKLLATQARKLAFITFATVCLVIGLLTVWTPLPTGIPLMALGIVVFVTVSATARRMLRSARLRSDALDRGLVFVETRTHRNMATMLKRTRPLARKMEAKRAIKAANAALQSARARAHKNDR